MNNKGKIVGGVLLLLLGIGLLLETTNVISFRFDGWWTLFIIIPCTVSLFSSKNTTMSLIGIAVGVLLLLAAQEVLPWDDIWKYIICIALIIWGIMLIFGHKCNAACSKADKQNAAEIQQVCQDGRTIRQINTSFGKHNYSFAGKTFEGAKVQVSFGYVGLDLRGSDILDGAIIDIECSFGGMEIWVGNDVTVKHALESSFAGVEYNEPLHTDNAKTLYLKGHCAFGGIEVK